MKQSMKNKYCPINHDLMTDNFVCAVCKALDRQREDMEKEINKKINRILKDFNFTFQGQCEYCQADFWNYDEATHTSICPMGKLELIIHALKGGDKLEIEKEV